MRSGSMQIQVNTDNHIGGRAELVAEVGATLQTTLGHLSKQITRVEVHLGDENGAKGGDRDIRCVMEARMEGHQPVAVTEHSGSLMTAVTEASEKLRTTIEHTLGRLRNR